MPTATRTAWMDAWEQDLTPSPAARRSQVRVEAQLRAHRYYTREATARLPQRVEKSREAQPLPELRVVTRRRPRWGAMLVASVISALLLGIVIVAPVLINSATTQVESEIGQMQHQQAQLAADTAALSAQISALSAPDRVAEQAGRLGLGPAQSVYYIETATETAATEGDTTIAER
jgi:cell division protein FtsL